MVDREPSTSDDHAMDAVEALAAADHLHHLLAPLASYEVLGSLVDLKCFLLDLVEAAESARSRDNG